MRSAITFVALIVCVFLTIVVQEFIPPIASLGGARLDLLPVFFCYGALLLPFPLAILLALVTGLLTDLNTLQILSGGVEIAVGWSIFLYVLFACILQGLRPLFLRGRWEVHAFASGICTIVFLAAQFVMITVRREGFEIPALAMWRILIPGSISFLIAPAIYFLAKLFGAMPPKRRVRQY